MTNALLSAEPGPGTTCRVCGAPLSPDSNVCARCGAAWGEGNRCPHCRTVSDVEPHPRLRFRCRVCGGPRVPLDDPGVRRSGREIRLLEQARRAFLRSSLFRAGGAVLLGSFGLSLLVTLFVLSVAAPGLIGSLGALFACAVPLALGVYALRKAASTQHESELALDQAWLLVASDLLRERGSELKADELARALRIDEVRAELLLAELSVNDFVHARVESEPDASDRVRIAFEAEPEALPEPEAAEKESGAKP